MAEGLVGGASAAARSATDLAELCAYFGALLSSAGVPVPVERLSWWAQITVAAEPALISELYWLARVTLVDRAEHLDTFDAVFGQVFRGLVDIADFRGDQNNSHLPKAEPENSVGPETEPGPPTGGVMEHFEMD